jgi:hypothetical protein
MVEFTYGFKRFLYNERKLPMIAFFFTINLLLSVLSSKIKEFEHDRLKTHISVYP